MKRCIRALLLSLGVFAVAMIPTSSQASAWQNCNDVQSACATFHSVTHNFDLTDERCDGHYVYLVYNYKGQSTRVENHKGCGNTIVYPAPGMVSGTVVTFYVCTEVSHWPDDCSDTLGAPVQ